MRKLVRAIVLGGCWLWSAQAVAQLEPQKQRAKAEVDQLADLFCLKRADFYHAARGLGFHLDSVYNEQDGTLNTEWSDTTRYWGRTAHLHVEFNSDSSCGFMLAFINRDLEKWDKQMKHNRKWRWVQPNWIDESRGITHSIGSHGNYKPLLWAYFRPL